MSSRIEPLHIAAEVDVSGEVWAGVADYQSQPHLFLAELLDLDRPRARRRLGQTFFLIAVTQGELRAILKAWRASALRFDGDPTWKERETQWESAWAAFKRQQIRRANSAWRVRGSFRAPNSRDEDADLVRWTLLRKTPVTGDHVRARMARIAQLVAAMFGNVKSNREGDDEPF